MGSTCAYFFTRFYIIVLSFRLVNETLSFSKLQCSGGNSNIMVNCQESSVLEMTIGEHFRTEERNLNVQLVKSIDWHLGWNFSGFRKRKETGQGNSCGMKWTPLQAEMRMNQGGHCLGTGKQKVYISDAQGNTGWPGSRNECLIHMLLSSPSFCFNFLTPASGTAHGSRRLLSL